MPLPDPRSRKSANRTLIIACGALAREIQSVIAINHLAHIDLTCLPATLHNRPERIPDAVRKAIQDNRDAYQSILIGYADCGTGGLLDRVCEEENVNRITGPHCYAFFSGTEEFLARDDQDMDAFFLTDFLARQFDTLIIKGLGIDRHPELQEIYFAHYKRLIYLEQAVDPAIEEKARRAADRLGLIYEKRVTGYGDLTSFILASGTEQTAGQS